MPSKTASARSRLTRDALRITALAINSGLHHLPDNAIPAETIEAAQASIHAAHDVLVGGGKVDDAAMLIVGGLAPLTAAGFDPLKLYSLATIARIDGFPVAPPPLAVEIGGVVVEFPAPATAKIRDATRRYEAAKQRLFVHRWALWRMEEVAYGVALGTGARASALREVRDFVHQGMVFIRNAVIRNDALEWADRPPPAWENRVQSETDLLDRFARAVSTLARHNLWSGTLIDRTLIGENRDPRRTIDRPKPRPKG